MEPGRRRLSAATLTNLGIGLRELFRQTFEAPLSPMLLKPLWRLHDVSKLPDLDAGARSGREKDKPPPEKL